LDAKLAAASLTIDVLQITGDMDKDEKFGFIRLFTSVISLADYNPRVFTATTATNTGIDRERLDCVLRIGLPRCIITASQERGRNCRKEGMKGLFSVYTDWKLLLKLLLTMLLPVSIDANHDIGEFLGINSAVGALSPEKIRERSVQEKRKAKYPLTPEEVRANNINAYNNLIDTVNLYFLPDLGCIHCHMEWFLAFGKLEHYPRCMLPCETQCFVCTGDYQKYILPIVYQGAIEFLKSRRLVDAMP